MYEVAADANEGMILLADPLLAAFTGEGVNSRGETVSFGSERMDPPTEERGVTIESVHGAYRLKDPGSSG